MFLTLCYAVLTVALDRRRARALWALKKHVRYDSVVFHCLSSASADQCDNVSSPFVSGEEIVGVKVLAEVGLKRASAVTPKQRISLRHWTPFIEINGRHLYGEVKSEDKIILLLEASLRGNDASVAQENLASKTCVQVEKHCFPKAWRTQNIFGLIVESSMEDFSVLGREFMNNSLCISEGMEVQRLMSVEIDGSASGLLDGDDFHSSSSPCWSSSDYFSFYPEGENCYPSWLDPYMADTGPSLSFLNTLSSLPDFVNLDDMAHDMYGGSNESLAEKAPSIGSEVLSSFSGSEDNDDTYSQQSTSSHTSNEAEATSHTTSEMHSPLKASGGESMYNSLPSSMVMSEQSSDARSGEAAAENPSTPMNAGDSLLSTPVDAALLYAVSKPPNILIYTGEDNLDSADRFRNIRENFQLCLHSDSYTIYLLTPKQAVEMPWHDNAVLLVVSCDNLPENVCAMFSHYASSGGKIMNLCSQLQLLNLGVKTLEAETNLVRPFNYKHWENVKVMPGNYAYQIMPGAIVLESLGEQNEIFALARPTATQEVAAVICQVHLELDPSWLTSDRETLCDLKQSNEMRLEILKDVLSTLLNMNCCQNARPQLTPGYILAETPVKLSLQLASLRNQTNNGTLVCKGITVKLPGVNQSCTVPQVSESELPLLNAFGLHADTCSFNRNLYFSNLNTMELGKLVIFVEIIPTTMGILDGFTGVDGIVAVARQQTRGKGRASNAWLSPKGCAMFTLHLSLPLKSELGHHLSCLQHLAALAVVQSVCLQEEYKNIDLRLKWPNDIYYGNSIKMGGVIVDSTLIGDTIHCFLGCGFNVDNSSPTLCVNDLVRMHSSQTGQFLKLFEVEEIIARAITRIEALVNKFQAHGSSSFLQQYYDRWLHSEQQVELVSRGELAVVSGLDEYGFLNVKTFSGEILTLHPDGNSFDMMKNLIVAKTR